MKTLNTVNQLDRIENLLTEQAVERLTFKETCEYLNYSKSYLYKLTHRHAIPFYKPGGKKIFFLKKDLDKWIFRNRIRSEEELDEVVKEKYSKSRS
jgi:excisionase family DNA binding protein